MIVEKLIQKILSKLVKTMINTIKQAKIVIDVFKKQNSF